MGQGDKGTMKKQTTFWTTKSGTKIRICDMSDSHLLNTVAMLERNASRYLEHSIDALGHFSMMLQGEMAQDAAEQELDRLVEEDPIDHLRNNHPLYEKLVTELERRKLRRLSTLP